MKPDLAPLQSADSSVGRGELIEVVRDPITKRWLVYGKESRRLIAFTDTTPDSRGWLAVHLVRGKP